MNQIIKTGQKFTRSKLVSNSAWGIASSMLQTLFICLFFAIMARSYDAATFAQFLIASTVYQLLAAVASMGLGQWFIRQYIREDDKIGFTARFLKMQTVLGLLFYLVNICLAYLVYPDGQVRMLCLILGTNIIFDNFINAIRSLNIVESRQRTTATILVIDGFLKLLAGIFVLILAITPVMLALLTIVARIITAGLFTRIGSAGTISLRSIFTTAISVRDLKELITKNWQFVVIGSISIIYWRIGNLIISKTMSLADVADYEIAFRIFSIMQILPVIASATIFPRLVTYIADNDLAGLKKIYQAIFRGYSLFAIVAYAFVYSFSSLAVPFAFGDGYPGAGKCLQQMSLTFLLMPTVLLQANLLVAMGLEKRDMWFNVVSLLVYLAGCITGLLFFSSLAVINYAILFSFLVFHLSQDALLISRRITSFKNCLCFYGVLTLFLFSYWFASSIANPYLVFCLLAAGIACAAALLTVSPWRSLNLAKPGKPVLS
ncbi:lipopolysaccharide biosynthesis protein [Hufsiella ginkgonis]|uniref:Oligosaccharide flippase family protein n=1 Tax=Hufsiella ginkgonis TaxID=2695274 RepID=A0A7K1XXW8_9SPHI|nr:oligosaccharide flippase family protein [Hufsiella ginkgonis]MXV15792.1 oligosaccharide flippase family protein [Hufsiella ginkgonis]